MSASDLVGPSAPQQANAPGTVAAPANTPTVNATLIWR